MKIVYYLLLIFYGHVITSCKQAHNTKFYFSSFLDRTCSVYFKVNMVKSRKFLVITHLYFCSLLSKNAFILNLVAVCSWIANHCKKRVIIWAEVAVFTPLELLQHLILELQWNCLDYPSGTLFQCINEVIHKESLLR